MQSLELRPNSSFPSIGPESVPFSTRAVRYLFQSVPFSMRTSPFSLKTVPFKSFSVRSPNNTVRFPNRSMFVHRSTSALQGLYISSLNQSGSRKCQVMNYCLPRKSPVRKKAKEAHCASDKFVNSLSRINLRNTFASLSLTTLLKINHDTL